MKQSQQHAMMSCTEGEDQPPFAGLPCPDGLSRFPGLFSSRLYKVLFITIENAATRPRVFGWNQDLSRRRPIPASPCFNLFLGGPPGILPTIARVGRPFSLHLGPWPAINAWGVPMWVPDEVNTAAARPRTQI